MAPNREWCSGPSERRNAEMPMLSPLDTGVLVQRPSVTEDSADDVDAPLSESNEQSILSGNRLWGVGLRLGDGVRSRQRIVEVICIE